jgi:hypothetical protein
MHGPMFTGWSLGHWLAVAAVSGVAYGAWRYDAYRKEHGYVEYNATDINPIVPDPKAVVAENEDMQRESEDGKP